MGPDPDLIKSHTMNYDLGPFRVNAFGPGPGPKNMVGGKETQNIELLNNNTNHNKQTTTKNLCAYLLNKKNKLCCKITNKI